MMWLEDATGSALGDGSCRERPSLYSIIIEGGVPELEVSAM